LKERKREPGRKKGVVIDSPADFTGGEIWGEGVNGAVVQKIRDFKIFVLYLGGE